MERNRQRSKEEEEELDRKIALIREKNLKIEQRSKEVEEDRINNSDAVSKKTSPLSVSLPKTKGKNQVWDREWDQGKTPAEQWRENVPSIEHSGRLASASVQNRRRQPNQQNNQGNLVDKLNKGSLSGRVTVKQDKQQENKSRGRRDGLQNHSSRTSEENGQKGRKENGVPRQEQRNHRRGNSEKKNDEGNATQRKVVPNEQNQRQGQRKNQNRRSNDNYVVKLVVKNLLDRVEKMERKQKREEEKKQQEQDSLNENPPPVHNEKESGEAPKENSPGKENVGEKADANQNVIQLTRERVLTVQSS